jgi:hypothetical protein
MSLVSVVLVRDQDAGDPPLEVFLGPLPGADAQDDIIVVQLLELGPRCSSPGEGDRRPKGINRPPIHVRPMELAGPKEIADRRHRSNPGSARSRPRTRDSPALEFSVTDIAPERTLTY